MHFLYPLEWNNVWFIVNVIGFVISPDRCGLHGEESPISGPLFFVVQMSRALCLDTARLHCLFVVIENNSEMTSYVILVSLSRQKIHVHLSGTLRILSSRIWDGTNSDYISRILCSSRQPGRTTLCKEW